MICEHEADAGPGAVLRFCALCTAVLAIAVGHAGFASVAHALVITSGDAVKANASGSRPQPGPNDAVGFEVVWSGLYNISGMRRIDDPKAPARTKGIVDGGNAPVQDRATMRIPAKTGTNFGVAFKFRNASGEDPVEYRAIWRFPKPGLINPKNKNTFFEYETTPSVCQRSVCVYGWSFSEPWEMVIGTWTLELWRGSRKLHEQVFEVVSR